jgi:hypothetical protein
LLLEFELEFELELLLEFELELELWLELELELEFELELLLWLELWFELELELVLELWFELELLLWLVRRLTVRRFCTARARHHSIGLPSILRSTRTVTARFAGEAAGFRYTGAGLACSFWDRAVSGPTAEPMPKPTAPSAAA